MDYLPILIAIAIFPLSFLWKNKTLHVTKIYLLVGSIAFFYFIFLIFSSPAFDKIWWLSIGISILILVQLSTRFREMKKS
jgi:hypothetical protein